MDVDCEADPVVEVESAVRALAIASSLSFEAIDLGEHMFLGRCKNWIEI